MNNLPQPEILELEKEFVHDYTKSYLISFKDLRHLSSQYNDNILTLTLRDNLNREEFTKDFKCFTHNDEYIIDERTESIKNMISSAFILNCIEFSHIELNTELYNKLVNSNAFKSSS